MTKAGLLLGVALALAVTAAAAEEDIHSANYIMPGCRNVFDGPYSGPAQYCLGVITGISHMAVLTKTFVQSFPDPAGWQSSYLRYSQCLDIPSGVTGFQTVRVVVTYIDARPERMHEPFSVLALEALRTAWPCK
jgi:hypothetical protein